MTSPSISFNQTALSTRDDIATITCTNLQSFSDVNDIKTRIYSTRPLASYEPDFWLLDGDYKLKPSTTIHVGLFSSTMSGSDRNFATDDRPLLTITFNTTHSTTGLVLRFSEYTGDWTDSILIKFFNAADAEIQSNLYTPSGVVFATGQSVSNFKKITVLFGRTNKAYRHARLSSIDFEALAIFAGTEVKEASLIESINPLSTELPMNTLDFSLFSDDGDFSIVDPSGLYTNLKYKEPIDAHEEIKNEVVYLGRFYLDKWESKSETLATFKASDAIGILEGLDFMGGWWTLNLAGEPVIDISDLLDRIFENVNFTYELDASFSSTTMNGYLPIMTCRKALQQVLFAIGAYANCARTNVVQIKPFRLASTITSGNANYILTGSEKGMGSSIELRNLVTGVEVIGHVFKIHTIIDGSTVIIFQETLAVGTHKIIFDKPYSNALTITGGTIIEPDLTIDQAVNYVVVNVTVQGTVTIEAEHEILDKWKKISILNSSVPAGTEKNVLQITDANFVFAPSGAGTYWNVSNYSTVAQRVYDYYLQRYLQKTKLFAIPIKPGDAVEIDSQGQVMAGFIEKIDTDLANGFVSNIEIIGII